MLERTEVKITNLPDEILDHIFLFFSSEGAIKNFNNFAATSKEIYNRKSELSPLITQYNESTNNFNQNKISFIYDCMNKVINTIVNIPVDLFTDPEPESAGFGFAGVFCGYFFGLNAIVAKLVFGGFPQSESDLALCWKASLAISCILLPSILKLNNMYYEKRKEESTTMLTHSKEAYRNLSIFRDNLFLRTNAENNNEPYHPVKFKPE